MCTPRSRPRSGSPDAPWTSSTPPPCKPRRALLSHANHSRSVTPKVGGCIDLPLCLEHRLLRHRPDVGRFPVFVLAIAAVGERDADPSRETGAGLRPDERHASGRIDSGWWEGCERAMAGWLATVSLHDLMEADRHARLLRRLSER